MAGKTVDPFSFCASLRLILDPPHSEEGGGTALPRVAALRAPVSKKEAARASWFETHRSGSV
jgi:hypothetical protein